MFSLCLQSVQVNAALSSTSPAHSAQGPHPMGGATPPQLSLSRDVFSGTPNIVSITMETNSSQDAGEALPNPCMELLVSRPSLLSILFGEC